MPLPAPVKDEPKTDKAHNPKEEQNMEIDDLTPNEENPEIIDVEEIESARKSYGQFQKIFFEEPTPH